jgi:nucleoid-associated protein YgaU
MNKPLKLLAGVAVLSFASLGLWYAWLTPVKKADTKRPIEVGSKAPTVGTVAANDESRRVPAVGVPSPGSVDVSPAGGATVATGQAVPAGFKPVEPAMQPLPSQLPGFEPTKTPPAVSVATTPAPTQAPTNGANAPTAAPAPSMPAPVPAAVATTQPTAAQPAHAPVNGAPAAAPVATQPVAKPTTVASNPPAAPAPKAAAKPTTYTVKAGDNFSSIWRGLTGSERGWESLEAANPGVDSNRLKIGQVLKVPDFSVASAGNGKAPAAAATTTVATEGTPGTYTVVEGDTLSHISSKVFGDSKHWKAIYEANKDAIGPDPRVLKIGQVLQIPAKSSSHSKAKPAASHEPKAEAKPAPAASNPTPAPASRTSPPSECTQARSRRAVRRRSRLRCRLASTAASLKSCVLRPASKVSPALLLRKTPSRRAPSAAPRRASLSP